jgi:hypothetical protein
METRIHTAASEGVQNILLWNQLYVIDLLHLESNSAWRDSLEFLSI